MSSSALPMFPCKSFIVSGLKFRSLIHFEFIFVYGVRKCSNFILLHVAVQFSQHHLLRWGFPEQGNLSSFTDLFHRHRSYHNAFLLVVGGVLPSYSDSFWLCKRYFARLQLVFCENVPYVDIFFMYLWQKVSSMSFYSTFLISTPQV